jgi:hypothetical protein
MVLREDLLDAQASVDRAVAQFPSLSQRIDAWLKLNVEVTIEDPDPSARMSLLRIALM